MRRIALPVVVVAALALAASAAFGAPVPHPLPAIALGAVAVWRAEVAAVLFVALYGAIVALRLALHGETLTRVGRDGIEIPRVRSGRAVDSSANDELATSVVDLRETVATLTRRLEQLDDPTQVVLRRDREEN